MHILVVEDHRDSAEALALLLENEGYTVQTAPDGEAGISMAKRTPPDVVLIDIELPGIDGYEVARRLRREPATQAAVLVAVTGRPDRQKALACGFDECLRKPASNFVLALLHGIEMRLTPVTPDRSL